MPGTQLPEAFIAIISNISIYFVPGFIIDYISHPVVHSFTTTSGLTIAEGQLKVIE